MKNTRQISEEFLTMDKCTRCKSRKEVTCPDCNFNYTQLVCRHCSCEHYPINIKFKDMKNKKPVPRAGYCATIHNPYYE